ncbi:hypothetical protein ATK17_3924 [Branchiibius hedensis]|uniref:TrbL/VirB6 plasmid conjugal transfer protein n=2 Tax=Branchiibius hedensis TaxID=672460 RepID=A0A2Y9BLS1_9MICO|nr:hypothetical protein ATK17_3924 [Branchiibius hedensis]SSA59109.1 hypothetical protein SAMN04489750_3924 [Branchiibius hedensis]
MISEAAASAFEKAVDKCIEWAAEAFAKGIEWSATWWLGSTPGTTGSGNNTRWAPPEITWIRDHLLYYTLGMMVMGFIIAGVKMALRPGHRNVQDILVAIVYQMLAVGMSTTIIGVCVVISDELARWLLQSALGTKAAGSGDALAATFKSLLQLDNWSGLAAGVTTLVALGILFFGFLASVLQWLLLLARTDILIVLAGVLPLSGSFTQAEIGKKWFQRLLAWTVAFILYAPTAALFYAAGFKLLQNNALSGQGPVRLAQGVMMFALAIVALGAIVKVVNPLAAAVASGTGGAALLGAAGVAGLASRMPSGARGAGGGRHSSSGGSGGTSGGKSATGTRGGNGSGGNPMRSASTAKGVSPAGNGATGAAPGAGSGATGATQGAGSGAKAGAVAAVPVVAAQLGAKAIGTGGKVIGGAAEKSTEE